MLLNGSITTRHAAQSQSHVDGDVYPDNMGFSDAFSGVLYPAWYTEWQKSRHGAIEIALL